MGLKILSIFLILVGVCAFILYKKRYKNSIYLQSTYAKLSFFQYFVGIFLTIIF